MEIFQKASKKKLRFNSNVGVLTVEDLWDLHLDALDDMAIAYKNELSGSANDSFIKKRVRPDPTLQLQLEICKAVIEARIEQQERNEKAAARRAKNEKIKEIIFNKENEELMETSKDELYAMLEEDEAESSED